MVLTPISVFLHQTTLKSTSNLGISKTLLMSPEGRNCFKFNYSSKKIPLTLYSNKITFAYLLPRRLGVNYFETQKHFKSH